MYILLTFGIVLTHSTSKMPLGRLAIFFLHHCNQFLRRVRTATMHTQKALCLCDCFGFYQNSWCGDPKFGSNPNFQMHLDDKKCHEDFPKSVQDLIFPGLPDTAPKYPVPASSPKSACSPSKMPRCRPSMRPCYLVTCQKSMMSLRPSTVGYCCC